jgi:putative ABC transport system permease protein
MIVFHEILYVLRGCGRAKAATAVLLISLGLGAGTNAVLFGAIRALLFEPPTGVQETSRLVTLHTAQFNDAPRGLSSYLDLLSVETASRTLGSLAAFDDSRIENVRVGASLQRVRVVAVSGRFFATLGLAPHAGRLLGEGDMGSQTAGVVVSHQLWSNLGAPDDLVGHAIRVGAREFEVVGIAPPRFDGLQLGRASDVWIPLDFSAMKGRGDRRFSAIGRLAADATLARAQQEVEAISLRVADEHPSTNRGTQSNKDEPRRMSVVRYTRMNAADRSQITLISAVVFGATGLLLVSACVNAGTLLVSRSVARRKELAVKLALGASRAALARQALLESLVLSLGGATLGLLIAYWTADALPAFFSPEEAERLDIRLGGATVLVAVGLAAVAGILFAIGPAWAAARTLDVEALRGDSSGLSERGRSAAVRAMFVTGQVAMSTVLLIGAGLLVRAMDVALQGNLTSGGRNVAVIPLRLPGYLEDKAVPGITFRNAATADVTQVPGYEAAAWIEALPVSRVGSVRFETEVAPGVTEAFEAEINVATGNYFATMQIPLLEGRTFTAADGGLAPPVAVVDDVLARRHLGGTALGRHVTDEKGTTYEIVGVVRGGKYRTFQETPEPMVYLPITQRQINDLHLVIRTSQPAEPLLPAIVARLNAIDRGVVIRPTLTFETHLAQALTLDRLVTTVVGACGLVALVLATIGVYGVIIDGVRRRTPEIGLRVALGAGVPHIVRLVFGEGMHLTALGAGAGALVAVIAARMGRVFVPGLPLVDWPTLAVAPLALIAVAVAAAALPTRRALRINPTITLRANS